MVEVSILSGEMVSGARLAIIPATSGSVRATLNGVGEIVCEIPLRDKDIRPGSHALISTMEPWRTFLAFEVGDHIVDAGPVVSHEYSDDDEGTLTVKAVGLRGILDHRLAIDATSATPQRTTLTYSNLSLGTHGKRLVQRTLDNPGGGFPVVLPPDVAGEYEYSYPGFEFATIGKRIADLSSAAGGPEFAWEPRRTTDGQAVEWVMRAGLDDDPLLTQQGDDWIWDTTVAGAVTSLGVSRDGSRRTNAVYVSGQGTDEAIIVASAQDSGEWARGYPRLDAAYSHTNVGRQVTLNRLPGAYLSQGSRPWSQMKLKVLRDAYPALGQYRMGDWAAVRVADHPYLPDGTYRARIGSLSASLGSSEVDLDLLPTLEWR